MTHDSISYAEASRGKGSDIRNLQEEGFGADHDYRVGSPHLKHGPLHDRMSSLLRQEIAASAGRGMPLTLLEVGAGHGGYTEVALASGCSVTATEMSRPSVARLTDRYGLNPNFSVVFDGEGSLNVLGDQTFSVILCSSVLHHIPDYLAFIEECMPRLGAGGTFLSIQDPMWYPESRPSDLYLTKAAYLSWRMMRGNYREGVRTQLRRFRGVYDEQNPNDMVEYHVVRKGVNQDAIVSALSPRFDTVSVLPYWSTQSALWQRVGEFAGRVNTFGLTARGFRG